MCIHIAFRICWVTIINVRNALGGKPLAFMKYTVYQVLIASVLILRARSQS